jgi:two-component sensor histidine kinase
MQVSALKYPELSPSSDVGAEALRWRAVFDSISQGGCIIERIAAGPDRPRTYRYVAVNPALMRLFGQGDLTGQTIRDHCPAESDDWCNDYDRVLDTGEQVRVTREMAQQGMVLEVSVQRLQDSPHLLLVLMLDVTERHTAQQHQKLLIGELNHRLKNLLQLVQAIAVQTLRNSDGLEDASASLTARIAALASATDHLTQDTGREGTLADAVKAGLSSVAGFGDRITVTGAPLRVGAQVALSITLAVHELGTNAAKYGALSNETGRINVRWSVRKRDDHSQLVFTWRERGGPEVSPPTRRGFGSRMIEQALRAHFSGAVTMTYAPEGVDFRIVAPLSDLADR